jgi:hypothetical protein
MRAIAPRLQVVLPAHCVPVGKVCYVALHLPHTAPLVSTSCLVCDGSRCVVCAMTRECDSGSRSYNMSTMPFMHSFTLDLSWYDETLHTKHIAGTSTAWHSTDKFAAGVTTGALVSRDGVARSTTDIRADVCRVRRRQRVSMGRHARHCRARRHVAPRHAAAIAHRQTRGVDRGRRVHIGTACCCVHCRWRCVRCVRCLIV